MTGRDLWVWLNGWRWQRQETQRDVLASADQRVRSEQRLQEIAAHLDALQAVVEVETRSRKRDRLEALQQIADAETRRPREPRRGGRADDD